MRKCSDYTSKHGSCSPRKQRCCSREGRNESSSPCAVCCSHGRRARSCSPVKGCRQPMLSHCLQPCDPCCHQRCTDDPCESYLIKRYTRSCLGCKSPCCPDCNIYDPCSFSNSSRYPCTPCSKTDTFGSRYDFLGCPPSAFLPYCPLENDPCCPPKADHYYKCNPLFTSRILDSCCPKKYDPCSLDKLLGLKKCDPCFPTRFEPCDPCPASKYDPCFPRKPIEPFFQRKPFDTYVSKKTEDQPFTKKVSDPYSSRKYDRESPEKDIDIGHPSVHKKYSTENRVTSEPPLPMYQTPSVQRQDTRPPSPARDPCADKREYIPCRKIADTCETIVLSKCERPRQDECMETRILTTKTVSPSCDKFNKVCYPREVPVKCDMDRRYEATTSDECKIREKKACPEEPKNVNCKPTMCNSPEPSRQFLEKFNALGTLPRFERHMCPWEADVTVNGNIRAHCDSTAVEIAKKMAGCYRAHGERCTTDSCGQIPVECDEGEQHINLGVLDDGTCLDFSRNNKQIRDQSTNMSDQVYKTSVTFDHSNNKPATSSSGHCEKCKNSPRSAQARSKSSLRNRNSANSPATPSTANASEKASPRYYEVVVTQDGIMTKKSVGIDERRCKEDFVEVKKRSAPSEDHLMPQGSVSIKGIFSSFSKHPQAQANSPSNSSEDITPSYHTATEMAHRSPQVSVDIDNLSDDVSNFLRHRKSQRRLRHRDLAQGEEAVFQPYRASAIPPRLSPDFFKNKDFLRLHHQKSHYDRNSPDRTCHGHWQHHDDDTNRREKTSPYEIESSRRSSHFLGTSRKFRSSNRETK